MLVTVVMHKTINACTFKLAVFFVFENVQRECKQTRAEHTLSSYRYSRRLPHDRLVKGLQAVLSIHLSNG